MNAVEALIDGRAGELESAIAALKAVATAHTQDPVPSVAEIHAMLPEKGVTLGGHLLLARAMEAAGEVEEADRIRLAVAERINQAGYWEALAQVTAILLERDPAHAAPLISRARNQGGAEAVGDELLLAAHRALPRHAFLSWQVVQLLHAQGDLPACRRLAAQVLPELIDDKNYEVAEEALLLLAEEQRIDAVRSYCRSLELLAKQEAWDLFDTTLGVTLDALASERGAEISWPVLKELWLKYPDRDSLRQAVARVAAVWVHRFPDPEALITVSEIDRPSQSAEVVLDRFRRAVAYPPGYYARHHGWGIGKILSNDTEQLVIDFANKPRHRMTYATAETALDCLSNEDLRVLILIDPQGLERMKKEEPATLLFKALQCQATGEGPLDLLRKSLVPSVMLGPAWTTWWKTAKKAVAEDPRIDSSRAYENFYRIAEATDDDAPVVLPTWNKRKDARKNLQIIDQFLAQHPETRDRVVAAFSGLVRAVTSGTAAVDQQVCAALWLARMKQSTPSFDALVAQDFDFNSVGKPEQEAVLEQLTDDANIARALESRLAGVRRAAWDKVSSIEARAKIAERALREAGDRAEAALFLLEEALPEVADKDPESRWSLIATLGLLDMLEHPPRETHRKRAVMLVSPDSVVGQRLTEVPITEDLQGSVTARLKRWEASDRYRFPFLEFLREVGHGEIADDVEGHRKRAAAKMSERMIRADDDPYDGDVLLTRPTWNRLQEERKRIGFELKTVIPKIIQSARELGDLKENAEYHAAKEKQANFAKRFEEIETMLNRVRLIENIERRAQIALPGTLILLQAVEDASREMMVWLLGEGDQDLGPEVVSYRAPVGEALHGKAVGETVELPEADHSVIYRIQSVEVRLPD